MDKAELGFQLWFFGVFTTILLTFLTPTLIMPLFNKYEPLGDQELKKAVEDLVSPTLVMKTFHPNCRLPKLTIH